MIGRLGEYGEGAFVDHAYTKNEQNSIKIVQNLIKLSKQPIQHKILKIQANQ